MMVPLVVLAIVTFLVGARACCRVALSGGSIGLKEFRAEVANSLITRSLVAGNQFLPGVAAACARVLPCHHTQAAVKDGGFLFQFVAHDTDAQCLELARDMRHGAGDGTCRRTALLADAVARPAGGEPRGPDARS